MQSAEFGGHRFVDVQGQGVRPGRLDFGFAHTWQEGFGYVYIKRTESFQFMKNHLTGVILN